MVHAGALPLEERVAVGGNPFPALTQVVKNLFLNTFSREHRLRREMEAYQQCGKLLEAADCAVRLEEYDQAFQFYNQDIARNRDPTRSNKFTNTYAAELAESLGRYEEALRYRVQAEDFGYAALDALRLGRHDEAAEYSRRLREG